jgi:hypothetical protein
MKKLVLLASLFAISCKKENVCEAETKPVFIQVQAIYIDGDYDLSEIVVVR